MQNKDDVLKVENLEKNEYEVTTSIVDVPTTELPKKERKITVFTVFLSALSVNGKNKDDEFSSIKPVKTLKLILMLIVATGLFYILYKLVDGKLMIPLILIYSSFAMPLVLIVFHYELCPNRTISLFQQFLSVIFGILLYIAISALSNSVLIKSIYQSTIEIIIVPVFWGIGELLIIAVLAKMYNITNLSEGILLAVCIGMGYCFAWCIYELFNSLFISVQINSSDHYTVNAILSDSENLIKSVNAMISKVFWYGAYYPLLISCWSVVIGSVISLTELFRTNRKDRPFSIYLLLVLVILLYMLSVFPMSFSYFDIIIKGICAFVTLYIAVKLENNALTRSVLGDKINNRL